MAKLRHLAIAAKDPDKMAEFYMKAFDFKLVRSNDGPLAYGHHLSDGTIDLAILRVAIFEIAWRREVTSRGRSGGQRTETLLASADFSR